MKQGPWIVQVPEVRGEPGYEEEGFFKDDKKEGRWLRYSLQGDKLAIENYRWGQKDGRCQYFNQMEDLIREESWLAVDPKNPYDTVAVYDPQNPNKILRYEVVKIDEPSVKHGTWRYFDAGTGRIEATEQYVLNRKKTKESEDAELAPIDPANPNATTKKEAKPKAKPKEVLEFEKKNAGKKKIRVREGNTGG
jgi:antitoxin component YwqK of YwqJK toxin-antitoxin module